MMHFEGHRHMPQAPATVWQKLSDAPFLVQCVPDVESVSRSEPDRAVCSIRPGLGFIRGTLELTIQVAEAVPESRVRLLLHTKGIGSSSDAEATLTLAAQDKGTQVHWNVTLKNISGLLKAVPQGLIKAAAEKVIAEVWTVVEQRMSDS